MIHEFEEEVVRAENIGIFEGKLFGAFEVFITAGFVDFAAEVAGESNKAFGIVTEHFFIDTGFIIHAFEMRPRDELYEVIVSGLIFCEEHKTHVVALRFPFGDTVSCHINIAADNGFYSGGFGSAIEFDGAV